MAKGNGLTIVTGSPDDRRKHAADVEAEMTGRPQPHGTYNPGADHGQVSQDRAGYMELDSASKDGDCDLVAVEGGVSGERGCCNLFEPEQGASAFNCGNCTHFEEGSGDVDGSEASAPEQAA